MSTGFPERFGGYVQGAGWRRSFPWDMLHAATTAYVHWVHTCPQRSWRYGSYLFQSKSVQCSCWTSMFHCLCRVWLLAFDIHWQILLTLLLPTREKQAWKFLDCTLVKPFYPQSPSLEQSHQSHLWTAQDPADWLAAVSAAKNWLQGASKCLKPRPLCFPEVSISSARLHGYAASSSFLW